MSGELNEKKLTMTIMALSESQSRHFAERTEDSLEYLSQDRPSPARLSYRTAAE